MQWWVSRTLEAPHGQVILVSWIVWVIGSIVLHELAHGWAALWAGDRTPVETGHMTWNPLVHMGGPSLIMLAIVGIAWGAMPVNPSRFRGRYDDAIVSFAGPAMNILLAAGALVAMALWLGAGRWLGLANQQPLFLNVAIFLELGIMLNLVLFAFNLLPIPPLDGARILSSFSPGFRRMWESEQAQAFALFAFIGVFFLGGRYIFGWARTISGAAIEVVARVVLGA
jgi:Zn-dependent protease